jgi:hypothetical protein
MTSASRQVLYEARELPVLQNRMYSTPEEGRNCPKGDVILVEDTETGLIFNEAFVPELLDYDGNYQNEQAVSLRFQHHLAQVSRIVERHLGRRNLIEVGCGKAFFLELLESKGFDITGFDPAYEGKNPRVESTAFRPGCGLRAAGLILRHVLEHIPNPISFLRELRDANGRQGKVYIEVPCFDWICQHNAWFDIFYEHVNYFRLTDFKRLFDRIEASGHLFGGQYIFVVADLASLRQQPSMPSERSSVPRELSVLLNVHQNEKDDRPAAIWGGASKGVIFALMLDRAGQKPSLVIDANPAKQGKYLAGTGLPVVSPDHALGVLPDGSTVYVMNSNYLEEIIKMSHNRFKYVGVDQ